MCEKQTLPGHEILSQLAHDDPRAFEVLCNAAIEDCIAGSPQRVQPRLRQLQFRVDGVRRRCRSPLGALVKMQALMWDSFLDLDQELQRFVREGKDAAPCAGKKKPGGATEPGGARVIEFRGRAPLPDG